MMKIMKNIPTVNDTHIKFKANYVEKTYILKKISPEKSSLVSRLICDYYKDLKNAGISIPKLLSKRGLIFNFEYCGSGLMEILKNKKLTNSYMKNLLNQIESILKNCRKNKVGLDPHIKNFTLLDDKVFYVDTFPPVSKEYINLLIRHNKEFKKEIKLHLKNYKPNKLFYHFLADLKKTKELNKNFYKIAKDNFIKKRYIRNFDMEKVNEIIKIEKSNISKTGFTLS